jgi:hypothetical protein
VDRLLEIPSSILASLSRHWFHKRKKGVGHVQPLFVLFIFFSFMKPMARHKKRRTRLLVVNYRMPQIPSPLGEVARLGGSAT